MKSPAPPDLFDEMDAQLGRLSAHEVALRIAQLEEELARLRRIQRARKGGEAVAGRPRQRRAPPARILLAYVKNGGSVDRPGYGARRATAEQFKISERHLGRIIAGNRAMIARLESDARQASDPPILPGSRPKLP